VLTIRSEQIAIFEAPARERFIEDVLCSLPEVFPGDPRVLDRPAMRVLIEEGIAGADRLGLKRGREITLYVFLLHELGPDFEDREPTRWIGSILRDPGLDPPAKLDLVYARLELASRAPRGA
jgi:hypothetical protein